MSIGKTLRQSSGSAVNTAFTSSSFTPSDNTVLVVIASTFNDGGGGVPTVSVSGGSLTWNSIVSVSDTFASGGAVNGEIRAWYAIVGTSPGSMQVTVSSSPQQEHPHVAIFELTGVNTSSVVGAIATNAHMSDAGSMTLSASVASDSLVFAAVQIYDASFASTTPSMSPGSGWTEDAEYAWSVSANVTGQVQSRTGSTSSSVAWADIMVGNTVAADDCSFGIAFEIKAAQAVTREQDSFRFYEDGTESSSTAIDSQNTDITREAEDPFHIRVGTQYTGDPPAESVELQYKENGDASSEWRKVP